MAENTEKVRLDICHPKLAFKTTALKLQRQSREAVASGGTRAR